MGHDVRPTAPGLISCLDPEFLERRAGVQNNQADFELSGEDDDETTAAELEDFYAENIYR